MPQSLVPASPDGPPAIATRMLWLEVINSITHLSEFNQRCRYLLSDVGAVSYALCTTAPSFGSDSLNDTSVGNSIENMLRKHSLPTVCLLMASQEQDSVSDVKCFERQSLRGHWQKRGMSDMVKERDLRVWRSNPVLWRAI